MNEGPHGGRPEQVPNDHAEKGFAAAWIFGDAKMHPAAWSSEASLQPLWSEDAA